MIPFVKRKHATGEGWNTVKYRVWFLLYLMREQDPERALTVPELAYYAPARLRSLQVQVRKWSSAGWRRILRRRLKDDSCQFGYIIGQRGMKWLAGAPDFLGEAKVYQLQQQVYGRQREIVEERRIREAERQAAKQFHDSHGYWPWQVNPER